MLVFLKREVPHGRPGKLLEKGPTVAVRHLRHHHGDDPADPARALAISQEFLEQCHWLWPVTQPMQLTTLVSCIFLTPYDGH